MTDQKSSSSTSIFVIVAAAISAAIAAMVLLGDGAEEGAEHSEVDSASRPETIHMDPGAPASEAIDSEASAASDSPDAPPIAAVDGRLDGSAADAGPDAAHDFERAKEMPPEVAAEFARAMSPIPEEERERLRKGMEEMPPEVAADFAEAGSRPIPADVLEDFQNPYPEIPAEVLEELRRGDPGQEAP